MSVNEQYRGWTIRENHEGNLICFDPAGVSVMPGAIYHTSISSAKKSIDSYILAEGDAVLFWQLEGQHAGKVYGDQETIFNSDKSIRVVSGRTEFIDGEAVSLFKHTVQVPANQDEVHLTGYEPMSLKSALALSWAIRAAVIARLEEKQKEVLRQQTTTKGI
jgi:hypothetical protein